MKTLIATLIATAVSAVAIAPASAAPVDKEAHRAAMDKAGADYRTAKTKCEAMKGNAEEVCEDEAKLAQARAELDAYTKYDTTGGNLRDARAKVVRAEHELADTQCDATAAGDKDRCKATANSIRDAALARLDDRDIDRAVGHSSSGELVSSIDSKDPATAAAVQKCEQMTGDARTACVVDKRGNVTTATNVAATTGAAVAANTREAVATVKEKTAAAFDRTKEMASNAAHKAENATERVGEKTARVASDGNITAKVKAGLVSDPALKGMEINVDTEGGVVMLSGFVESKAEADKAMQVAKGVDGVTNVKSTIKVK
ncbi:BON domain-containing protein [Massilia sp. CFBP9012]|uniref:BON domain-containing protein n=1 Tax=Massilia sp. CFBP9012 TaxID=3096531 RepID=UPI002A6AA3B7|nr:BON domain-containing protein [Massilia sp. CFBP9012]MDY0977931.1 BON domain-containing protein [Massilia sp. CFBP9012]